MRKKRRLARAHAPIVVRIYLNIESNLFPCLRGLIYYYAKPILFFTSAVQVSAFLVLVFHPYPFPCESLSEQIASSSDAQVCKHAESAAELGTESTSCSISDGW